MIKSLRRDCENYQLKDVKSIAVISGGGFILRERTYIVHREQDWEICIPCTFGGKFPTYKELEVDSRYKSIIYHQYSIVKDASYLYGY